MYSSKLHQTPQSAQVDTNPQSKKKETLPILQFTGISKMQQQNVWKPIYFLTVGGDNRDIWTDQDLKKSHPLRFISSPQSNPVEH